MNKELKPCPFCESEAKLHSRCSYEETGGDVMYFVRCTQCGGESGWHTHKPTAIEAWNQRTPDVVELQEEIEELEIITGLMQKRTYYRKFIKEVWQKQEGKELSHTDFDYIYKLYFELIEARDKVVEQLEIAKKNPNLYVYAVDAYEKAIEIVKGGAE